MVKARIRGDRLVPSFIDPEDPSTVEEASLWISTSIDCVGVSADEAESRLNDLVSPGFPQGAAFAKLLFDRFDLEPIDESVSSSRWQLIRAAAEARKAVSSGNFDTTQSFETWKSLFFKSTGMTIEAAGLGLYSDLPGSRKISDFKEIEASSLVNLHNVAQLQGLILNASHVKVSVAGASLPQARRLFMSLRFHRLLPSSIEFEKPGTFSFELGGPLSIFDGGSLYGVNICNFVPNLFALPKWGLEATVKFKKRQICLKVNEKSGYQPLRHLPEGHVPEEFQAFVAAFNQKKSAWTASVGGELLSLGRDGVVVPDMTFENGSQKLSLELFHRWHVGALQSRLEAIERQKFPTLMIGWPRALSSKIPDFDGTSWLSKYCFTFGDFPLPQQVLTKILAISDSNH